MLNIKSYLFLYLFALFSFAQSNSDSKSLNARGHSNKLHPNLEPDYPNFTPFEDNSSDEVASQKIEKFSTTDNLKMNPSTNNEEETLVDKLMPFTDYIFELYKVYKNSHVKHKLHKPIADKSVDVLVSEIELDEDDDEDEITTTTTTTSTVSPHKKNIKRKRKKVVKYNIGPGVNVSLDIPNEIVKVHLDEESLKDVFTGKHFY